MGLASLDSCQSFEVLLLFFVDQFDAIMVEKSIHFRHDMRILHHHGSIEVDEVVLSQVVGQIGEDKCSFFGFLD